MSALLRYSFHSISRRPWQTLSYLLGLLLAVGLFADTLFFVDLSQRDMTRNALAPVRVDMIARATTPELSATQLESTLANQALVRSAVSVASADFANLTKLGAAASSTTGSSTTSSSTTASSASGKIFALGESYYQQFDFLPIVDGGFDAKQAMVGDATATQLGLKVGDTLELKFAAGITTPYRVRVSGIVGMGASEPLFFNPDPAGGEGYGVVADVVFLPPALFERDLAPALSKLPVTTSSVGQTGSNVVLLPIERQVHLKIDRSSLHADPTKAAKDLDALRSRLERPFPGQVRVQDNLGKKLFNAKKDILAAKMLFIFLALPGVLLAAYLSKYAVELSSEQLRRELGLLRVRGAGASELLLVTLFTTLLIGGLGVALGLAFGALVLGMTMGWQIFSGANLALVAPSAGWAALSGFGLTALAFFLPTWGQLRAEISGARRVVSRYASAPLWRRMGLDFVLLIAASVVLYITDAGGGFKPTGTEGTAVTLSFYLFLAPFMFWIGGTLLLVRLLELLLTRGSSWISQILAALFGDLGRVAAQGMSRRSGAVGAAVTLTALALSFGVALSLFLGTYDVQKQGDMRFVVGSDLRVTPPASANLTPDFARKLAGVKGVLNVTSLARDPVALIGSEKKSVYGIDAASFEATAYLPDAMFENGSAHATLKALDATSNGVLVARDQADKFGINVGDLVLMRLYNPRSAQYIQVQTKAVGIFTYLSTSSQDSDFVLNRAFMTRSAGTRGADLLLVKTARPSEVTAAIQQQFGGSVTLKLESTQTATKIDESSLTSLNLAGLGGLERLYTALIVASSLGVFLISMLQLRRREFGTMRSLGTDAGQLRRLLAAEALSISSVSLVSGIVIGVGIALLFVMLLRVIFLIPPSGLALPTADLTGLLALSLVGMTFGVLLAQRSLAGLRINEVLRED